jgi:miniconductance mechanosensitive channel
MQVIKIFIYCLAIIIIVSIILNKDPETLVVGLGAFAAVLMLVFKDTILGFVAGIQLMSNKMVNLGDWIVMPSANADGEVLEINLVTVKVQNWDKTISTIPTYKLVSESFTNWRGMQESNGRRIKRSVYIDVQSVHYLTQEELEKLQESVFLKDYIAQKMKELEQYNADRKNSLALRRLTNIGTFREYMESWIAANPHIAQDMTHMVRQLQPGPTGIPLEIYCFSSLQQWVYYERVQADLFDHLYAVIPLFNLRIFQYPSDLFSKK